MGSYYLTKKELESGKLDKLPEKRRNDIMSIKSSIALNTEDTLNYATDASKNLTNFSTELLRSMKLKDIPEVEDILKELLAGLGKVDADTLLDYKPSFFKRLTHADAFSQFLVSYDNVAAVIEQVKGKLEQCNFQLKKDIEICNRFMEQNLAYINDLDNYIMAGKLKLDEEHKLLDDELKEVDQDDRLDVYNYNAHKAEVERFERKLYDLTLMREIAVQNIPQIMLIRDGDSILIEKIQSSINSAIPLWESQLVIAVQLLRQKGVIVIQKSMTDATNAMIVKNGQLLKSGSIEVAKELERGIIDVEVLKKNSETLISTLEAISTIREEGREKRLQATQELAQLQSKLNEQLLLSSKGVGANALLEG